MNKYRISYTEGSDEEVEAERYTPLPKTPRVRMGVNVQFFIGDEVVHETPAALVRSISKLSNCD